MIKIDILQLVDRLEELLDAGMHMPFSKRVMVDEEAFLNIIDQMRITIPQEIRQAREVQVERDKYIAQAHEEARRIIAQAREDAARLLDEHELRKVAEARSETILNHAQRDAARIRASADEYAETKLRDLADAVAHLQRVIDNGLQALQARRIQRDREIDEQSAEPMPAEAGASDEASALSEAGSSNEAGASNRAMGDQEKGADAVD
ncbi:MAG TPA: ATPase [Chloroflexi bacterium]|nr:hypothetical protein [Thermobispora sp.]HHX65278.1 ATPase [Chloroflexota bacterium]